MADKLVFISYSRADAGKAYELERRLMANGARVWIDKRRIEMGDEFDTEIREAIEKASAFLLLWSRHSAEPTSYVHKEIELALAAKKRRGLSFNSIVLPGAPPLPHAIPANFHYEPWEEQKIHSLMTSMARQHRCRTVLAVSHDRPASEFGWKSSADEGLIEIPFIQSVCCNGSLLLGPEATLGHFLNRPTPEIAVFVETLGKLSDYGNVRKVLNYLKTQEPDRRVLLLHILGPRQENDLKLTDHEQSGEWLDVAATIREALEGLLGKEAKVQFFLACPVPLAATLAHQCDRYWRLQFVHRRQAGDYQLVLDTAELSSK